MLNKKRSVSIALALLLLGQMTEGQATSRAGEFDLQSTTDSKGTTADVGHFGRKRFTFTFDSRFGYDDNTLAQPDGLRVQVGTNPSTGKPVFQTIQSSDSAFINFALGFGYTAASPRLTLTIGADVGVNYFFDRPGRSYDINGGLSARFTYRAAPRLVIEGSTYNAYEAQGDYGATTLTNFNGQFNGGTPPPGSQDNRNGDFFYTTNYLAGTYQLSPRVSLVLSDTFVATVFDDSLYAEAQDRVENYTQLEGRYLIRPTLSLAVDYRFGYINYFSSNFDSTTHFALAGFDYTFSPRLRGSFRAGAEFRQYFDAAGDEISPYGEGTLTYDLSRNAHLSYVVHYGIEEGDQSTNNTKSNTLRTGVSFEQQITARLSGYASFYYTHSYFATPEPDFITSFNDDTFDVAIGGRYSFNRHFAAEIGYTHTTVLSNDDVREYDRNRVFAGVRFAY